VVSFLIYTAVVILLSVVAHRMLRGKAFLEEYYLGSRGLGVWALAMSYAATSASGGSFMGFPALIYQHGWVLALWVASHMILPITCMGLLGKRINQIARKSGAITVPDIFRDRFRSPSLGIVSSLIMVFLLIFYLVAQFKAGATIMKLLLGNLPAFQALAGWVQWIPARLALGSQGNQDAEYYLALLLFALLVVAYTAYGGFRAVVWTDVLQGIVMVAGVLILLVATLRHLPHGLGGVTRELQRRVLVPFTLDAEVETQVPPETLIVARSGSDAWRFATEEGVLLPTAAGSDDTSRVVTARYLDQRPLPQSFPPMTSLMIDGGEPLLADVRVLSARLSPRHNLVAPPGYDPVRADGFVPMTLAISYFFLWALAGAGQPATMVRLMAFRDSSVFRRAMFGVCIYTTLIYVPLLIIFVAGRTLLPAVGDPDEAMPALVLFLVPGFLGGIILAAPFAAVMSTVDSFLLTISSSLVRDIFQRSIRPDASPALLRRLSYGTTAGVGAIVLAGAMNPPRFLQHVIVLASSGLACSFLAPMFFSLYWKRTTTVGVYAGMLGGLGVCLVLYTLGWSGVGGVAGIEPYYLGGFLPFVWGLAASILLSVVGSLLSPRPCPDLVAFYFHQTRS